MNAEERYKCATLLRLGDSPMVSVSGLTIGDGQRGQHGDGDGDATRIQRRDKRGVLDREVSLRDYEV